jgi:AcrR family transcriptional regulator
MSRSSSAVWQARAMGASSSGDSGASAPARRVRAGRSDRRDALVDGALKSLGELGETATVEDLAARMGVNKAALYRHFGNRAGLHRALVGEWVSRALSDYRANVLGGRPSAQSIESGFLAYLTFLEQERSTYLALSQLGHVAGPRAEEHVATFIASAGDVVTRTMYALFPGVPPGSELGRTWGQALAGMAHHVADRWARSPWASKEEVAHSLARLVGPALESTMDKQPRPPRPT